MEKKITDTGRRSMTEILRNYGLLPDGAPLPCPEDEELDLEGLAAVARRHGLKASLLSPALEELKDLPVPSVVRLRSGHFAILVLAQDAVFFLIDPALPQPLAVPPVRFAELWTGEMLTFSARWSWAYFKKKYNLPWFHEVIKRYRPYLIEVLAAGFFLQALGIAMPLMTQVIIDKVIGNHGISTLTVLGVSLLVVFFLQAMLSGLKTYLLAHTTNKIDALLGTRLFRHLICLPLPYFENRKVGDTLMRLEALTSIREFMTGTGLMALLDVLFSVVFVAFMLYYSPALTAIAMIIIPLYLVQNLWSIPLVQQKIDAVWRQGTANQSFLVESITNMETVKALAVEPQFQYRWEELVARYMRAAFENVKLRIVINGFSGLIQTVASLGILWYGGHMVMDGRFTLGQLIAFQMIAGQAMQPLQKLLTVWPTVQQTGLALERMGDILGTSREPLLERPAGPVPALKGGITFSHVSFRYRPDLPLALEDVSLEIKPGEKVALIGRSGSGKSTLSKLIQRLYLPDSGSITLDSYPLERYPLVALRRQIGVVSQDSFLFNRSVRENIALYRPEAGMREVIAAAKLAGAHEFILELKDGYDTIAGERGSSLSGGQRQRIAIARMLLTDARLLVFDEATSALDYASEHYLMQHLEEIRRGRTMLVIAHRYSMAAQCSRILVMDQGRIVDEGTPAELRERPGLYRELYLQQAGGAR